MKKIILTILIFISIKGFSQDLSGITVNITLRAGDWAFVVGNSGAIGDSTSSVYLNRLRDTVQLANPANFNTNVRFNSMPAQLVYNIYVMVKSVPANLYDQVGTTISTNIKAIVSTPLQTALTVFDNTGVDAYQSIRRSGKIFLQNN